VVSRSPGLSRNCCWTLAAAAGLGAEGTRPRPLAFSIQGMGSTVVTFFSSLTLMSPVENVVPVNETQMAPPSQRAPDRESWRTASPRRAVAPARRLNAISVVVRPPDEASTPAPARICVGEIARFRDQAARRSRMMRLTPFVGVCTRPLSRPRLHGRGSATHRLPHAGQGGGPIRSRDIVRKSVVVLLPGVRSSSARLLHFSRSATGRLGTNVPRACLPGARGSLRECRLGLLLRTGRKLRR